MSTPNSIPICTMIATIDWYAIIEVALVTLAVATRLGSLARLVAGPRALRAGMGEKLVLAFRFH